jgi:hypothetical protein
MYARQIQAIHSACTINVVHDIVDYRNQDHSIGRRGK